MALIIFALIIRLILANLPGFKIDVDAWFAWSLRINEVGLSNFYSGQVWTNYTPGYLYFLWLLGFIKNLLNLNSEFFYFTLKLPAIISEIILGILVYKISKKHLTQNQSLLLTSLVLFNPAIIFNSSVWGQIDGLLTLLMVFSIYFLNGKNFIYASIFFGLALLVKPQALSIMPVFILFSIKNFSLNNLLKISLPAVLVFFLWSLPFFPTQPFSGILNLLKNMVNDYPYTSVFAYNSWGIVGFWINDSQKIGPLSYQNIGLIFLVVYWLVISIFYFKKNLSLYTLSALAALGFYFLPTRAHDRYLYPALLFILLSATESKFTFKLLIYICLSFIHLLNLYFVYVYYNELFLKLPQLFYNRTFFDTLQNSQKTLSIISTTIFIVFFGLSLTTYAKKINSR